MKQIHALQQEELPLQNESSSEECFILFHLFIFHRIVPNHINCPLIDFPKSTCSSGCPQSDVTPELISQINFL